jgi:hypothetical protein
MDLFESLPKSYPSPSRRMSGRRSRRFFGGYPVSLRPPYLTALDSPPFGRDFLPPEAYPNKTLKVPCCCSVTLFLQHQDLEGLLRAPTGPACHTHPDASGLSGRRSRRFFGGYPVSLRPPYLTALDSPPFGRDFLPPKACPNKTFKVSCCCSVTLFLQHQDLEGLLRAPTGPACHTRVRRGGCRVEDLAAFLADIQCLCISHNASGFQLRCSTMTVWQTTHCPISLLAFNSKIYLY